MGTLILYASMYGAVEECAKQMQEIIGTGSTTVIDCKRGKVPTDLSGFETIILGCSVHASKIQDCITGFARQRLLEIGSKRLGLFVSATDKPENTKRIVEQTFEAGFLDKLHAVSYVGGKVDYKRMNFIVRGLMKRITKRNESFSTIDEQGVRAFAERMSE